MRIDLLFPRLPPAADGIGDYTSRLAVALSTHAEVRILTAQADAEPVPGAEVVRAFSGASVRGLRRLAESLGADVPDWLVVQYNPFSWGRWGFNPALPEVLRQLRSRYPWMRLAVMVHEPFVPLTTWQFCVMSSWQRWQLWQLGRAADVVFCSIEAWAYRFAQWFPETPVHHLSVGSNISDAGFGRDEARRSLVVDGRFVLGLFGSASTSMLPHVKAALEAVVQKDPTVLLLYVGGDGTAVRAGLEGLPVRDVGRLAEAEVSRCFSSMDLFLAPYPDGVSTRRGTVMAALAHGISVVSTVGSLTDSIFTKADGSALFLADAADPSAFAKTATLSLAEGHERERVGMAGRALYESVFSWHRLSERMVTYLRTSGGVPDPPLRQNGHSDRPWPAVGTSMTSIPDLT